MKYISDAFEEAHARLNALEESEGADPVDPDEYRADGIFWVPREARWTNLQYNARQPTIGRIVDDAMLAIERDNPVLRDVLSKEYARQALDQTELGQVIDLIIDIRSVPGVGEQLSLSLLAYLPELGNLDCKQVAALAGVAPFSRDSDPRRGKRSVWGGRSRMRATLCIAALAAGPHNPVLRGF